MQPTDHTSATTAQLQVTVSHTSGFTHIDNLLSYLLSRHTSSVYLFFGHCRLAGRKGIWCVKNPECGNAGDGDLTGALHILSIPVGHHCHLHHSLQQQNPYWSDIVSHCPRIGRCCCLCLLAYAVTHVLKKPLEGTSMPAWRTWQVAQREGWERCQQFWRVPCRLMTEPGRR